MQLHITGAMLHLYITIIPLIDFTHYPVKNLTNVLIKE